MKFQVQEKNLIGRNDQSQRGKKKKSASRPASIPRIPMTLLNLQFVVDIKFTHDDHLCVFWFVCKALWTMHVHFFILWIFFISHIASVQVGWGWLKLGKGKECKINKATDAFGGGADIRGCLIHEFTVPSIYRRQNNRISPCLLMLTSTQMLNGWFTQNVLFAIHLLALRASEMN